VKKKKGGAPAPGAPPLDPPLIWYTSMVQLEILLCAEVVLSLLNLAAFIGLGLVHYTARESEIWHHA